jgi:hypothetical protein
MDEPRPPKTALAKLDFQTAAPSETSTFASTIEGNLRCVGYAEITAHPICLIVAVN